MEATKNSPALILQRRPYRENDSLVTAYTLNFGKLALVARGAKKLQSKLAGHLEPLTRADLMIIAGRGFDYVGAAAGADTYPGIRADLNKLYYAGRALGLFDRLVKESQADGRLFFLLADWLRLVNDYAADFSRERGGLFYAWFVWKFLAELGYGPQLYQCLQCGRELKPGNYFNLLNGGVLCRGCWEGEKRLSSPVRNELIPISDNVIKIMRFLINNDLAAAAKLTIFQKDIKELTALLDKFLIYHF
jgi:DNA repair protein RecO (recombination protein O)